MKKMAMVGTILLGISSLTYGATPTGFSALMLGEGKVGLSFDQIRSVQDLNSFWRGSPTRNSDLPGTEFVSSLTTLSYGVTNRVDVSVNFGSLYMDKRVNSYWNSYNEYPYYKDMGIPDYYRDSGASEIEYDLKSNQFGLGTKIDLGTLIQEEDWKISFGLAGQIAYSRLTGRNTTQFQSISDQGGWTYGSGLLESFPESEGWIHTGERSAQRYTEQHTEYAGTRSTPFGLDLWTGQIALGFTFETDDLSVSVGPGVSYLKGKLMGLPEYHFEAMNPFTFFAGSFKIFENVQLKGEMQFGKNYRVYSFGILGKF